MTVKLTLSSRGGNRQPSPLAALMDARHRAVEAGHDVIDLSVGDAILPPPEMAIAALTEALADPRMSRYGFQQGYGPFREAVAHYLERRFGLEVDPRTELLPLVGSKEGLAHLAPAVADATDPVIVPDPCFLVYHGGILTSSAEPYRYELSSDDGFLLDLERLPGSLLQQTRLVYLNYPNNPTAATASLEYLERTVTICRRYGIAIAYDNAYAEITYGGTQAPSILQVPGARDVAIEFQSTSKSFGMTGWRLGWAVGNRDLVRALAGIKVYLDTGPFLAVQRAAVPVLDQAETLVPRVVHELERRNEAAHRALLEAEFQVPRIQATPFYWLPLPAGTASGPFASQLLREEGVMVLPGSLFGASGEGYIRLALCERADRITEAVKRIGRLIAAHV